MRTTSRRVQGLVLALVLISVLGAAAQAVASGYVDWDDVSGLPGQGTSPHGGYAVTTQKCAVCHAVHNADIGGQLLMRDSVADACAYCHVGGAGGYIQVYEGLETNYAGTDFDNAHNYLPLGPDAPGVKCTTCHQVHAADEQMTANPYLTQKLLIGDKTFNFLDPNYDPIAQEPLVGDDKETALTKWCAGCHFTSAWQGSYYADDYNLDSHINGAAGAVYGNPEATFSGQVAWKDSSYCTSCHASGYGTSPSDWPHFTDGNRFLVSAATSSDATAAATESTEDGVCLRCHRDGSGDGVGLSY